VTPSPRSRAVRLLAAALIAGAPLLAPDATGAGPAQDAPGTGVQRPDQADTSDVALRGEDLLRATSTDVNQSLAEVTADVRAQVAAVAAARTAQEEAETAVADAEAAVAATEQRIEELTVITDEVVIDAFITPPVEDALETLAATSLGEATVRQSLLDSEADASAAALTELEEARGELEARQAEQSDAAEAAEARAAEVDEALTDLVAAQTSETRFVLAVQDRLASRLAEADALEDLDPAAAEALRAREAEIAGTIEVMVAERERRAAEAALARAMAEAAERAEAEAAAAAQAAASAGSDGGTSLGPATGSLTTVACPGGGAITVDASLGSSLAAMLAAASAAGWNLCGNGYRDPSEQIALRRANCGSSDYAIYEAPSSACSPPTARPGTSNHEQGTAIDFTCNGGGTLSSSSGCFGWLVDHAAAYGFYNLPSEPWHWSNDGT
jgi:hypothetical protein